MDLRHRSTYSKYQYRAANIHNTVYHCISKFPCDFELGKSRK